MNSRILRQDIEEFQAVVKKLSGEIGKAASIWNDSKYSELFSAVSNIASISKEIIVTGEKSCTSIEKFAKLAEEQY